jgi:hypothetical protein
MTNGLTMCFSRYTECHVWSTKKSTLEVSNNRCVDDSIPRAVLRKTTTNSAVDRLNQLTKKLSPYTRASTGAQGGLGCKGIFARRCGAPPRSEKNMVFHGSVADDQREALAQHDHAAQCCLSFGSHKAFFIVPRVDPGCGANASSKGQRYGL